MNGIFAALLVAMCYAKFAYNSLYIYINVTLSAAMIIGISLIFSAGGKLSFSLYTYGIWPKDLTYASNTETVQYCTCMVHQAISTEDQAHWVLFCILLL